MSKQSPGVAAAGAKKSVSGSRRQIAAERAERAAASVGLCTLESS
jgi:hypothetical protein